MKNYKELTIWQKAMKVVREIYKVTARFPDNERFGLTAQIRRAAVSIPANIAEGWGRGTTREYIQFLLIARGCLMEVETQAIIARDLSYLAEQDFSCLQPKLEEVGRMLNGLIQSLRTPSRAAA